MKTPALAFAPVRDSQTCVRLNSGALAASGLLADLQRLEAHQEEHRWGEAEVLASELLDRWPDVAAVLVEVARLRVRQGRRDEAMLLLDSDHVGQNVRLLNHRIWASQAK
jgi:hypothetical protein